MQQRSWPGWESRRTLRRPPFHCCGVFTQISKTWTILIIRFWTIADECTGSRSWSYYASIIGSEFGWFKRSTLHDMLPWDVETIRLTGNTLLPSRANCYYPRISEPIHSATIYICGGRLLQAVQEFLIFPPRITKILLDFQTSQLR